MDQHLQYQGKQRLCEVIRISCISIYVNWRHYNHTCIRYLRFSLNLRPHHSVTFSKNEGSGDSARASRRLAKAFVSRMTDKFNDFMSWFIILMEIIMYVSMSFLYDLIGFCK